MILADGTLSLIARQASMPGPLGHPHVEQHDVGGGGLGQRGALDAVAGLADDLEPGLDREQHGQPAPEQLLVVDHQHPDRLALGLTLSTDLPRGDHRRHRADPWRRPAGPALGPAVEGVSSSRSREITP